MKRLLDARSAPAIALGIIALVLAAGGGAYAATNGNNGGGTITVCVHKNGGGLYRARKCPRSDPKLSWNATGRRGLAGPQGATGLAGAQGTVGPRGDTGSQGPPGTQGVPGTARGFAFVKADGTVVTKGGSVDIAVNHIKTGEYCLTLTPAQGTFVPILATIQGPDLTPALISVNTSVGSDCNGKGNTGVFTMNNAGTATDEQFVVAIM